MLVLGLESTCDESGACLLEAPRNLLANVVRSQVPSHSVFGGVVPEVASRLHLQYLAGALEEALKLSNRKIQEVDCIAASNRPGLLGGLLVGTTLGKSLAYSLGKPFIAVDHLLGHLLAADLDGDMHYPCVAGIFSGAHSNVYIGQSPLDWKLLARTRDDAPGEAFDKVARILGLPYPGGPSIQKSAENGDENAYDFPIPLPPSLEGDFSFSGLKTSVLYQVRGQAGKTAAAEGAYPDLAASFQRAAVEGLVKRMLQAAEEESVKAIYVGGGVAANKKLREELTHRAESMGIRAVFPTFAFCMDNAAMIAGAGAKLAEAGRFSSLNEDVATGSVLGM